MTATAIHDGLSPALASAWAKSDDEDRSLSLVAHAADACAVAGLLYENWLPDSVRNLIRSGGSHDDGRALVRWLAACHDAGKLSPAFACQVPLLANRMRDAGLQIKVDMRDRQRRHFPHSVIGHGAVEEYLKARGWDTQTARSHAVIAGSHHGVPPESVPKANRVMYGGPEWHAVRTEFLDLARQISGADQYMGSWKDTPLTVEQQVILTGVVIVADWLASDADRFPLGEMRDHDAHAAATLAALGLPQPWRPRPISDVREELGRFGVPEGVQPNPVQMAAVEMARSMGGHGLMLIESVMGTGKTEAALMAAQQFGAVGGHGGLFIALPTMATSNAMFGRVLSWLQAIPDLGLTSAVLAHGKADLNDDFRGLLRASSLSSIECDCPDSDSEVIAHRWLSGNKKSLLANFVVGTIDQLLFLALKSRHLMLRHLALAGKVVVIDEVHAADDYMREYLKRALEWLAAYKVPVIMLSATLPSEQRVAYAEAYARGLKKSLDGADALGDNSYPALFGVDSDARVHVHVPQAWLPLRDVGVCRLADDDDSLIALLSDLLVEGGCAAVVRNTVRRAQQTAHALRAVFGSEVLLLHSAFVAQHRADLEHKLMRELGCSAKDRPQRLIVVATQVVEQSLDVDFDVMVSDLAPIDLLFQRIGRLHRHDRVRTTRLQKPTLFITGVLDWSEQLPQPIDGSKRVYEPYDLLRAIAVLRGRDTLSLPTDISTLVQTAYASTFQAPAGWEKVLAEACVDAERHAEERRSRASDFRIWAPGSNRNILDWLANHGSDADGANGYARVRDGSDSIEVIVTRRVGDMVELPISCGGKVIPTESEPDDAVARKARTASIRLPYVLSLPGTLDRLIPELERRTHRYVGWRTSKWLKGELALELDDHHSTELAGFHLHYDEADGLIVTKETK